MSFSAFVTAVPLGRPLSGRCAVCPRTPFRHTSPRACAPDKQDAPSTTDDALLRDAQRMRKRRAQAEQSGERSVTKQWSLRSVVDTLLLWDFFLVVGLLVWLVVALVPHFAAHNDALLDPWLALWQPFIQPVLGVLMLGTIAQGAWSFFSSKE